ncbi:MAG: histidine kinase [Actinomycetes bacterium]
MDERKIARGRKRPAANHPSMRVVTGQDQTGELSWPLVDRRQLQIQPPTGVERRQLATSDDLERLSAANQILLSLQKIAITLPSSFDLEKVLDQGVTQVQELIKADIVTVLLASPGATEMSIVRGRGSAQKTLLDTGSLPLHIVQALAYNHSVSSELSQTVRGFADEASTGSYCALRSRGFVVGLIAAEWREKRSVSQQTQILTGIADALGVAVDNARLFRDIRQQSASEERLRIARDLHDRTGSTLAFIGIELDRLIRNENESPKQVELTEIRGQVTKTISEVREMLYDLRTGQNGQNSLSQTVQDFAERVNTRSPIDVECDFHVPDIADTYLANEIWEMIKEAILNAENHSQGSHLLISTSTDEEFWTVSISDNGIGMNSKIMRIDAYGLTGMFERAESIGAEVSIVSPFAERSDGTQIVISIPLELMDQLHSDHKQ